MGAKVVGVPEFDALIPVLRDRGYDVIGPTIEDGTIVLDHLTAASNLPIGWTDAQEKAAYSLERRDDDPRRTLGGRVRASLDYL